MPEAACSEAIEERRKQLTATSAGAAAAAAVRAPASDTEVVAGPQVPGAGITQADVHALPAISD